MDQDILISSDAPGYITLTRTLVDCIPSPVDYGSLYNSGLKWTSFPSTIALSLASLTY